MCFGSKEKMFQSKKACHFNFYCLNSFLKQRVKKWMIKMCNGNISDQSEEVTREHMLPKNGAFSKRWRRTSVLIACYWRLCPRERIHPISTNGYYTHVRLKQHITFPDTKSKGKADTTLPGEKEKQNKLLGKNISHTCTFGKTKSLILVKQWLS